MIASSKILPSGISSSARDYIAGRLADLAASEEMRLMIAIESGSRAWGFPSADSDYDVRFIYVRPRKAYLSVRDLRDVIETPLVEDPSLGVPFDLNGWDVRKALRLALGSNPVLHEWLVSPIRYAGAEVADLHTFVAANADLTVYHYHYDRQCRAAWSDMETEPAKATIKRYCYALRPALMRLWLKRRDGLPPMDVHNLCNGLSLSQEAISEMATLFAYKRNGGEGDAVTHKPALNNLILEALTDKPPRPAKRDIDRRRLREADALFASFLR